MPAQVRKEKAASVRKTDEPVEEVVASGGSSDVLDRTDELLDEIDEAIRGLDTDLATKYVQKGGQ